MNDMPEDALTEAIIAYDYPPVTYDFAQEREVRFSTMRGLDDYLQSLLRTSDALRLKDGLSGILYWGHYRAGYRDHRVKEFRARVASEQLQHAIETFRVLEGTGLMNLQKLTLPEFRYMAFVTKLRTFLDPERYCVLDSKIASLTPLATRLKRQPTYIPITAQNDRAYTWWIETCGDLASRLHIEPRARPVDVERGLFYLVDHGKRDCAEQLLGNQA